MRNAGDRGQGIGGRCGLRRSSLLAPRSALRAIRRRAAGFTIIELMVAAVIALVIFGIGLMMITGASGAHQEAKARIRTNDRARMFFEQFERDLSGAYTGHYRRDALVDTLALVAGTYTSMTTTTEDFNAGAGTEYQSVRYYVVKASKRLCRQTTADDALPMSGADPDLDGSTDAMLCSDVAQLETSFAKWAGGTYQSATGPLDATHLLVKLTLLDPNEELRTDQRLRIYQVYIPIPDGLDP